LLERRSDHPHLQPVEPVIQSGEYLGEGISQKGSELTLAAFCFFLASYILQFHSCLRRRFVRTCLQACHCGIELKQKGFSLIELLIVVAIILIIAAIAIPNLLRARMAANESSAVASIRTINTAEVTYNTAYPTVGYAPALVNLGGALGAACVPSSTTGCMIDAVLANNGNPAGGGKSGYQFTTGAGTVTSGVNAGYT
jgi:type IV pilus assembly protein PilA